MSKLTKQFSDFLSAIEPDNEAIGYASEAHNRVRKHLEEDEKFKEYLEGSFLYGSYKRNTAICEIKDVDIVLLTNFNPDEEENTPQNVLKKLKDAINRHYKDSDNQQYQRRSIRVDDPLPEEKAANLTLDVIPAYAPNGDGKPLLVPDRELKEWVPSHPKGHIEKAITLNDEDHGDGMYVPLVKLMKYWWKYQCELRQPDVERPKPKGFWVECLTAENFDQDQESYADHFISVLENISEKYLDVTDVPELEDPGLQGGEKIKTSMTLDEFQIFMEAISESLELAYKAEAEEDESKSAEIWREIFGEKFPNVSSDEEKSLVGRRDIGEQFISDFGITENLTHDLKIDAWITRDGFRPFRLRGTQVPLQKLRSVEFFVENCNAPHGCEIRWKVKNYGLEAREKGDLRGQIYKDGGNKKRSENTKYSGNHYVECYVINNGICIAKDRIDVRIG